MPTFFRRPAPEQAPAAPSLPVLDRRAAFADFARRRAEGHLVAAPTLLPAEERRRYVRATLLEDNLRVGHRPDSAQAKFDRLARSAWDFFRGTALLYYRDVAGTDAHLPAVFAVGDVHPENFGVMPGESGQPIFGIDDYDEACIAPYTFDVDRGAVGFLLAARHYGLGKDARRRVVRAWAEGYAEGLRAFARDDRERWFQYRLDNSPPWLGRLLEKAQRGRAAFLDALVDPETERFRATDRVVPHGKHLDTFRQAVDAYRGALDVALRGNEAAFFTVRDVAVKKGSGTASLGLDRYYVLIEGTSERADDDVILEFKQARRSALCGLTPPFDPEADIGAAEHIARAQKVHTVGGDPFYGAATIDGRPFVVREHSPLKRRLDLDGLDADAFETYARLCGEVLAQTHARSDADTGGMGNAEARILATIRPSVFVDDVERQARAAARRLRADYRAFRRDHALGAFDVWVTPEDAVEG